MAYVPGCRFDIFISYASENNRDGWVEQFEKALGQELSDLLGRQFIPKDAIFFDKRELEIAQSFSDQLVAAAQESAILIPILSPHYLTSPWCNRERKEFFSSLPDGAEPAACLAPVLVRPIDESGLDALYRNAQRMSFLSADGQTPLAVGSPEWATRVREFTAQLKNALQKLRQKCKPVFLGKTVETERSQKLRVWCRTELERRHFRTVPEALPALDDTDAINANLQQAGLAIHFLGGADSIVLEAIESSVSVCLGPTILYQPYGAQLVPDEELYLNDFERELKSTPGQYQRLAGKNDQELLALIDEQVTRGRAETSAATAEAELAIVCEEADLDAVHQLKAGIKALRPVEIETPDFVAGRLKAMERLRKWKDYLSRGKAFLFYYGNAERSRLELLWQTAEQQKSSVRRKWFLAVPELDGKRQQYPDALSSVDQVVAFMEQVRSARA